MKNSLPARPNLLKIIQDNYNNKRKQIKSGGMPPSLRSQANMSNPSMDYMYDDQMFYDGGYISDRAKATQFGQYRDGGLTAEDGIEIPPYNYPIDLRLSQFRKPGSFFTGYGFSQNPVPNVNVHGIGAYGEGNVNDRMRLSGNVNSASVFYPGGNKMFMNPRVEAGMKYRFQGGGDISIPNVYPNQMVPKFGPGGATTDGCPPYHYKNAQGQCVPEYRPNYVMPRATSESTSAGAVDRRASANYTAHKGDEAERFIQDYQKKYPGMSREQAMFAFNASKKSMENQGEIKKASPKRSAASKALAIATNPMTALEYKVKGQDIPDNFEKGERNTLDYAIDIINPFSYVQAAKDVKSGVSEGNYTQAGLGLLNFIPGKFFGKAASKLDDIAGIKLKPVDKAYSSGRTAFEPVGPRNYTPEELRNIEHISQLTPEQLSQHYSSIENRLQDIRNKGKYWDETGAKGSELLNDDMIYYHGTNSGRPIVEVKMPDGSSQYFYKSTGWAGKKGAGATGTTQDMWQVYGGHNLNFQPEYITRNGVKIKNPDAGKATKDWFVKGADYDSWYGSNTFRDISGGLDLALAKKYGLNADELPLFLNEKNISHNVDTYTPGFKRGGGYFPPYHSYAPPRMDIGGPTLYSGEGFGTTLQTTVDPSVEKARDCGKDCNNKAKGIIDYSTSAERKQGKKWDKEAEKAYEAELEAIAKQKAEEWANYTNINLDPYDTRYPKKDNTFSENYNRFITANPNFVNEQSTLGLSPQQRYAMLYKMSGRSGSPDYAAPQRLRTYMNLPQVDASGKGTRFTDQQLYDAIQRMGGIDKYADWWRGGWQQIQRNGGDIRNLNTDDMSIMDYMRYGGIYAYANGGNTKVSIVDYLNAQGMASDKASRKKLAESMGIKNYTGSYDQNVEMVTRLNNTRYNPFQQAAQNPYVTAPSPAAVPAQSGFGVIPRMSQPAPRQAAPAPRTSKKPAAQKAPAKQQVIGQDNGFRPYSPEQLNQMYNLPGTLNFKKPVAKTAKQAAIKKTKQANAERNLEDQRNLESGMITDKGTNMTHVIKNGKIVRSFPVLTGEARDVNYSPYTVNQLAKNPSLRGTPVGTYFSKPDANLYGEKGFRMNPIPAFGQQAPVAQPGLAQHITFGQREDPAEYRRREALYNQSPAARATSYGCTNCRKPDLDYIVNAFPKGDTTMVIDSRRAADAKFLKNKFKKKAHGGENNDYSGTYSAGVYYGQGGSFVPEFYDPRYGLPQFMYGTEMNDYSGSMYNNGGLVKGGEYDMTEQEIQNLIDQGYKIQYI